MKFDKHVFVCLNERLKSERKSCGEATGLAIVTAMKRLTKEKGLNVRINKAGCLDSCECGPALVVYPEGTFYGGVSVEDVEEIVESHLVNDQPVERLVIDFDKQEC